MDYGLRTGYKTRTGYKMRTKHYGLGINYGLRGILAPQICTVRVLSPKMAGIGQVVLEVRAAIV